MPRIPQTPLAGAPAFSPQSLPQTQAPVRALSSLGQLAFRFDEERKQANDNQEVAEKHALFSERIGLLAIEARKQPLGSQEEWFDQRRKDLEEEALSGGNDDVNERLSARVGQLGASMRVNVAGHEFTAQRNEADTYWRTKGHDKYANLIAGSSSDVEFETHVGALEEAIAGDKFMSGAQKAAALDNIVTTSRRTQAETMAFQNPAGFQRAVARGEFDDVDPRFIAAQERASINREIVQENTRQRRADRAERIRTNSVRVEMFTSILAREPGFGRDEILETARQEGIDPRAAFDLLDKVERDGIGLDDRDLMIEMTRAVVEDDEDALQQLDENTHRLKEPTIARFRSAIQAKRNAELNQARNILEQQFPVREAIDPLSSAAQLGGGGSRFSAKNRDNLITSLQILQDEWKEKGLRGGELLRRAAEIAGEVESGNRYLPYKHDPKKPVTPDSFDESVKKFDEDRRRGILSEDEVMRANVDFLDARVALLGRAQASFEPESTVDPAIVFPVYMGEQDDPDDLPEDEDIEEYDGLSITELQNLLAFTDDPAERELLNAAIREIQERNGSKLIQGIQRIGFEVEESVMKFGMGFMSTVAAIQVSAQEASQRREEAKRQTLDEVREILGRRVTLESPDE